MTNRPDPRLIEAIDHYAEDAAWDARAFAATEPGASLLADAEDARRLRESVAAIPDALRCWCCKNSKKWGRHEQSDGTWPTCTPCNGTGLRPTLLADAEAGRAVREWLDVHRGRVASISNPIRDEGYLAVMSWDDGNTYRFLSADGPTIQAAIAAALGDDDDARELEIKHRLPPLHPKHGVHPTGRRR